MKKKQLILSGILVISLQQKSKNWIFERSNKKSGISLMWFLLKLNLSIFLSCSIIY